MLTIELTQINDTGFDPTVAGYDLESFRHYHVVEILHSIDEGHLVFREVKVVLCDPTDPTTNLLLAGTVARQVIDQDGVMKNETQPRVVWDGKLWRVTTADTFALAALLHGYEYAPLEDAAYWAENLSPDTIAELTRALQSPIVEHPTKGSP